MTDRSLPRRPAVTRPQHVPRRDCQKARDGAVEDGDDCRHAGEVDGEQQECRCQEDSARQVEQHGKGGSTGTDVFERPVAKRLVVHPFAELARPPYKLSRRSGDESEDGTESDGATGAESDGASEPDAGPVVEYCANNWPPEARSRLDGLECRTRRVPCLERCGTCRTTPFVVVDGSVRTAETQADIVAALREGGR